MVTGRRSPLAQNAERSDGAAARDACCRGNETDRRNAAAHIATNESGALRNAACQSVHLVHMARAAHPLRIDLRRRVMPWLGWIILGLIAGYIASKNKDSSGIALDIVLGIVGALVGGYVFA